MTGRYRTSSCPCGHRCESCGVERDDLTVHARTGRAWGGVLCLTLCPRCANSTAAVPVSASTAARLVQQHCQHLGITTAQMFHALEAHR